MILACQLTSFSKSGNKVQLQQNSSAVVANYKMEVDMLRIKRITRDLTILAVLTFSAACASPARAVPLPVGTNEPPFSSGGAQGSIGYGTQMNTGTQTLQGLGGIAPSLSGATNGTIGPQGVDATFVTGVNTAGTVRVNNLANLEALLNIIANGLEILGIAWGGPTMILGFMHMAAGTHDAMKRVVHGAAGVTGGLATPGCINWLVASARDANLFS
jgi:hypothetical protein